MSTKKSIAVDPLVGDSFVTGTEPEGSVSTESLEIVSSELVATESDEFIRTSYSDGSVTMVRL